MLDDAGWDGTSRVAAVQAALNLVAGEVIQAETDIPWGNRGSWPDDVLHAAERLRDQYVPETRRVAGEAEGYLQTGVATTDPDSLQAFITFAPYAFDATFWAEGRTSASLAYEGTSVVVSLTDQEHRKLVHRLGASHVPSLEEWQARHPSALQRLVRRLRRDDG